MSQTVTQKQCIESKTSWVHQVHTLPSMQAHCVVSQAWPGRVAGLGGCIAARMRAPLRRIAALSPAVSRLYRDTTQQPSRVPVTIRPFVSRHSPSTARPSRVRRLPLRAGRPYHSLPWPCHGLSSPCRRAVSWSCPACPSEPLHACVMIQSTVS